MQVIKKILFLSLLIFVYNLSAQTTQILKLKIKTKQLPFGLTEKIPEAMPTVAVALSGGGARGFAQIGVLKAIKEANIPIDMIVGTSIGSIIGGLYSAGYSIRQLDSIAINTDWQTLLASERETNRRELFVDQKVTEDKAVFSLRLNGLEPILPTSLNNGQKISSFLNLLVLNAPINAQKDFDNLRFKYRAVCTNLVTGKPVIMKSGSLSSAMRASSSVSFLLAPLKLDSLTLVDGGLVANIPVKIASNLGGRYIIAVNTTSGLNKKDELNLPWEIADQVVSIPMKILNENQLKYANFVIDPTLSNKRPEDFTHQKPSIQDGYFFTLQYIDKINNGIDSIFINNLHTKQFFIKNVLSDTSTLEAQRPYILKYSMQDSVSNYEIYNDLRNIFSSGNYSSVSARVEEHLNYSTVNFDLVPNPIIKNVKIKGVKIFDKNTINYLFKDLEGGSYNAVKIEEKLLRLIALYRKKGYLLAQIKNVNFNTKTGLLIVDVDEGKISSISIIGNINTNSTIISRELPFNVGDNFYYKDVEQGLKNLSSTNLFDDIFINEEKKNNKNIIIVHVREKPSSLLRVGFRVDNEYKAQLSLDLRDENLFGSGTELGLLLFGGTRNRAYVLEQKANRIFNTYLTYKLNAYYKFNDVYYYQNFPTKSNNNFERKNIGEYRQVFYGASAAVGMQLQKFGNLIIQGKYQIDQIKNLINDPETPYKTKIVSLNVNSTIDTQDKYPYPTKGLYFKAKYETAQTILGGKIGFTSLSFDYKNYLTVGEVNTFSPRIMMGFADKTLPLSEQFSLGGQNSFFGMRDNEFRGRQIFLASLGYRYKLPIKIFFDTYFKLRYDIGSTWKEQEEIKFKDLKHGIGATLSFDTPIGPADFSIGKSFIFTKNLPGNPISFGDTYFYFSIGYYY